MLSQRLRRTHRWQTASYTAEAVQVFYLKLQTEDGLTGIGAASVMPRDDAAFKPGMSALEAAIRETLIGREMTDFDRVLGVNLRGAFLCARQAVRHFLSRPGGGVILNNSSVHEIIPKPKYLPYSISKGGMENLTKSLALEYAGQGIRVNAVGPGAVVTPINKAWIDNPKARGEVESHIPMGRAAAAG